MKNVLLLSAPESVRKTNLIGTEEMARECLCAQRPAGVNTLQVNPTGCTLDEQIATFAWLGELVEEISTEP